MSGDVQPRKRKDKKKKKDEVPSVEELRGTAATFGEGDVLMHSPSEHGTGGHWCAKIVFFSLLAILVGLIGLIILENRGLSELEANAVESQYAGILDGWIEEAPDDHHDEHTLELTHPDEEEHDEAEASDDREQEVELEDIEEEPQAEPEWAERARADTVEGGDSGDEDDVDQSDEEASEAGSDDDDDDDFLQHDDDEDDDKQHGDDDEDENNDDQGNERENTSAAASSEAPYEELEESSEQLPADSLLEEEEYSRQQERRRQEEAATSHLWLKLGVGAALLLATHAVVRRATRRAASEEEEEVEGDEDAADGTVAAPPDRRMTLLPDEPPVAEVKRSLAFEALKPRKVIREPSPPPTPPLPEQPAGAGERYDEEEDLDEPEIEEADEEVAVRRDATNSRATPDDEDEEAPGRAAAAESESDEELPDDVEIVEDEEEAEEEEISDVDDGELLSRLEAKYGRLPEPERYGPPARKLEDDSGANSFLGDDEWGDEPSDPRQRRELDQAEEELHRGSARAALARAGAPELRGSARARWLTAAALDALAEQHKDNALLARAAAAYLDLLAAPGRLSDGRLRAIALRAIDRLRFKGDALAAEPAHRALMSRFPDQPEFRNELVISYLMANRAEMASTELQETLRRWPEDGVALAHYGFVLKTHHGRLEESVGYLRRALDGGGAAAADPRFHYHLGDALLQLGRRREADRVHRRAAELGHFPSAEQRSLYNVARLAARPWWDALAPGAPHAPLASALEAAWREIRAEGEAASALYELEREGLRERGEWSQLDVFARGREVSGRCARAPVTCRVVRAAPAAAGCRRGQVKFSLLQPGTHIRPHVGPTNCRLRMHLGLANTSGAYLRVHNETREWSEGKVLMFDDSFEHEVWHNGTGARLVLIVDVWHPELTASERAQLPAI